MSLLKLSKHYAEKYIKGRNWENIEKILQTKDLYWRSVRFQYAFVQIWYVFGRRKWLKLVLYVLCTEICTKCVREKRISLHLSSISFNREKKRLFEKKRYGEFIFRIWNDSSQVPTKKSQFYKKIHFLHSEKKIILDIWGEFREIFYFWLLVFIGKNYEIHI